MPGRPPKPIAIHLAEGTYRKARHAGKLVAPDVNLGDPPEWFDGVQKAEWTRLAGIGHIKAMHRATVEHYCVLYSRMIEDARGTRDMTASERQTFNSLTMHLALTPASQGKIPAVLEDKKATDPWAQLG